MYYVSYVEEYPIYEPAEGGYYYAGQIVQDCRACNTWRKAKRVFNNWRRWFEQEYGDGGNPNVYAFDTGGCNKYGDGSFVRRFSRYVGDSAMVQITRYEPKDKGWVPYE